MFRDLRIVMSTRVSYNFYVPINKFIYSSYVFLKMSHSGNSKLQSFTTRLIFVIEPNFLQQNVCRTVAEVKISVSQVNLNCFELRKM